MIVTDEKFLRLRSEPCKNIPEGLEIGRKLHRELRKHKTGVGLSAPQIGILKQVFVAFGRVFINPEIIKHSAVKILWENEGCLSFPRKYINTMRWPWVVLRTINSGVESFGCLLGPQGFTWEKMLEAVIVTHEYEHLHGILFTDNQVDEPC